MNCRESFELLYRYIDKDVSGLSCQEIDIHLQHCRSCWDRFEFEKKLRERLKSSCHKEACPEGLRQRIQALLEKY